MKTNSIYLILLTLLGFWLSSCEREELLTEKAFDFSEVNQINASSDNMTPLTLAPNFIWGINGHTLTQAAYAGSIDTQLDLVKQLGMSYYRVDVALDASGTPSNLTRFNELLTKAESRNIKILPMIYLQGLSSSTSEADAQAVGYAMGLGFSRQYGSQFDYYGMGNEQEVAIMVKDDNGNDQDGSSTSHYDLTKFKLLASYFKGLNSGLKSYDPTAKTIIDNGGWLHYGYFQLLASHNVPYDILGLHWYSSMGLMTSILGMGNILEILSSFNKPIWITEINRKDGSLSYNGSNFDFQESADKKKAQSEWLEKYIKELNNNKLVQAYFVYELFDEPEMVESERHYGLVEWTANYTTFTKKPAFTTMQYMIEESQYGYEDFIYAFYDRYRKNTMDGSGIKYWSDRFKAEKNKSQITSSLLYESHEIFVDEVYATLLDTTPNATERAYWINRMRNGLTREDLLLEFCNSQGFWELSGSTNDGFVNRLYTKLLGRNPDSSYWLDRLNSGTPRSVMASETLRSEEYIRRFIKRQYLALLKRPADVPGENAYTQLMQTGTSQQTIIQKIIISDEYWISCITEGYTRRNL